MTHQLACINSGFTVQHGPAAAPAWVKATNWLLLTTFEPEIIAFCCVK